MEKKDFIALLVAATAVCSSLVTEGQTNKQETSQKTPSDTHKNSNARKEDDGYVLDKSKNGRAGRPQTYTEINCPSVKWTSACYTCDFPDGKSGPCHLEKDGNYYKIIVKQKLRKKKS